MAAHLWVLEARTLLSGNILGVESLVNATVPGVQASSPQVDRSIAVDLDGNLIAAWSSPRADGRGTDIIARRVDPSGRPIGGEFVVNTTLRGVQGSPVVAASAANTFVVAWEAQGHPQDRGGSGVFARVFSRDGAPLTGEIPVNGTKAGRQGDPSVAWLTPGRFVVAWDGAGPGANQSVFARTFDAGGTPLTAETRLSGSPRGGQREVAVVALPAGGYQAAWSGPGAGDAQGIFSRQFDVQGQPVAAEFRASVGRRPREQRPALAVAGDQVVIAWQAVGDRRDGVGSGVLARRFGLDGTPLGAPFLANQTTADDQENPSIAPLADGGFVVAWQGRGVGDRRGVFLREFDADGTPRTDEQRANTTVAGVQANPTVLAIGAGYAVAWDGRVDSAGSGAADRRGIALRTAAEAQYAMPMPSVGTRDEVMKFSIPGIGVISEVSPKTITFTNTTNRTIYPILESANNNTTILDGKTVGLYDPYDEVNREYRGYVGYKDTAGGYFLGLRPGETATVQVPLVFWDAGRILFASDGANLIPKVDNVAPPAGVPNSPNPFRYHDFQNFTITEQVLADLKAIDKVSDAVIAGLRTLLGRVYTDISLFKAAASTAVGPDYGPFEVPILNRAGAVIPTKRFRDDLDDGVHAVLWYQAQGVGGMAEGPSGDAPAQLAEMTFRSDIFANPAYLTNRIIDPDKKSGEVHNLVNYDVSYVDSMTLPVAIQAFNVPLDRSGVITTARAPFGWVGADKTIGDLQGPLQIFTSPNSASNANGLGNYFGGRGYPKYYIPEATEAVTGIKVPAGQNLALESPITDGRSDWDQNRFILNSSGSEPLTYAEAGAIKSTGRTIYFGTNYAEQLAAVKAAVDGGKTVLLVPAKGQDNYAPGTTVTGVDLTPVGTNPPMLTVTVSSDDTKGGTPGGVYDFDRPVDDFILRKLSNLWFSWADHYYDAVKGVIPAPSYPGTVAPGTNVLALTTPVDPASLVVGMPVSGPGIPDSYGATIIGFRPDPNNPALTGSVLLSKVRSTDPGLADAGGSGMDYTIKPVRQIRPQNAGGFPIEAYSLGFSNPADPTYDVRFARSVYVVMDSMNTIAADPTKPAIVSLMANVIGGNIGFLKNIGVTVDPKHPDKVQGNLAVADAIRDSLKSVLRGVDDFQVDREELGRWYPDPSLTGDATGQTINGNPADFNLYNLNPFVWFVHKKLGLSGYGFSLDDDAADVGADGASDLRIVIGSLDNLPSTRFFRAEWTHGAPYGPVKSNAGTVSTVTFQGQTRSEIAGLDELPLPIYLQVFGVGSSGEPGALVSGPGITPGTRILNADIGGKRVILDTPAAPSSGPVGPFFFTGTPPKVAIQPTATRSGANALALNVLGIDTTYDESALSYTWTLLVGPAGAATFSANASNAAKATRATFAGGLAAGTYTFRVTIAEPADAGGFATTADVSVVIPRAPLPRIVGRRRAAMLRARKV